MSGICGIARWNGAPVSAAALDAPMAEMVHYGRDGSAVWREGVIALGHQMTHVTPESLGEHLPFHDAETGLTITCDARLDNRDELFAALSVPHTQRAPMPDSVLILRAYAKWGEETPIHLLGDFAFAIWDSRRRKLFCARDIMGVRPFHYHTTAERFVFAGDMKAMLAFDGVPPVLDMITLAGHLQRQMWVHKVRSFYRDVPKLPAAHALVAGPTGARTWSYWDPENAPDVRFGSDAAYAEALVDLLQQAVTSRVRSAFPVGAHVSGGLDSSSIAVLAARALCAEGRSLKAGFSWSPPLRNGETYLPDDERPLVEAVCAQERIPLHYTNITAKDQAAPLLRDISTQPTETMVRELVVSDMAARAGVRVLLSGWGGDELISFNGRGFYAEMLRTGRWATLYREARARGLWSFVKGKILLPMLPDAVVHALRPDRVRLRRAHPEVVDPFLVPSFAERLREARAGLTRRRSWWTSVRETQLYLLHLGHLSWRIEAWAALGATKGIVYRYPLLDRRIIEFALGLPPEMYVRDGMSRYLFRLALQGVVPESVHQHRSKRNVGIASRSEEMRKALPSTLLAALRTKQNSDPSSGYVDITKITRTLEELSSSAAADSLGKSAGAADALRVAFLNPSAKLDEETLPVPAPSGNASLAGCTYLDSVVTSSRTR